MAQFVKGDFVLFAYIFFLVPSMLIGFGFARRRLFVPHHKFTMTTITIINWILILLVMVVTYSAAVEPNLSKNFRAANVFIPTVHGLFGLTAQILATYLVIRMWFENRLPKWIKVKNIKTYMRLTLSLWLITALFGVVTWAVIDHGFLSPTNAQGGAQPAATEAVAPGRTEAATQSVGVPGTQAATPAATRSATEAATQRATPAATKAATPAATKAATPAVTKAATPAATKAMG